MSRVDRRTFLSAGAGTALLCSIGGTKVALSKAGDAAVADRAAAKVKKPASAKLPIDTAEFPRPEAAPGGVEREYWIQARTIPWDIAPTGRDEWHDAPISGKHSFRAFVYQLMTAGFVDAAGPPQMPGPTLHAEVGDLLVVHVRNADHRLDQAITMHPHGVRYNPNYDGAYMGDFTRPGGFIEPGEEFTYLWEATPDSVGVWPYHDHGPNHTLNTFRGLFGAIVVREKGAKAPDVEQVLYLHSLIPPVTGLRREFQCINGRSAAGNTPTITAKVGPGRRPARARRRQRVPRLPRPRAPLEGRAGAFVDTPSVGPNEAITVRFTEDNPGRWLYHCHVFSHQDAGMAGWYVVEP